MVKLVNRFVLLSALRMILFRMMEMFETMEYYSYLSILSLNKLQGKIIQHDFLFLKWYVSIGYYSKKVKRLHKGSFIEVSSIAFFNKLLVW